jgi:hypothetical protein
VASDPSKLWHFAQGEESRGPFNEEEFARLMASGEIGPETRVWHEGLPGWVTLKELHEVRPAATGAVFASRPSSRAAKPPPIWRRIVVGCLAAIGVVLLILLAVGYLTQREQRNAQSKAPGKLGPRSTATILEPGDTWPWEKPGPQDPSKRLSSEDPAVGRSEPPSKPVYQPGDPSTEIVLGAALIEQRVGQVSFESLKGCAFRGDPRFEVDSTPDGWVVYGFELVGPYEPIQFATELRIGEYAGAGQRMNPDCYYQVTGSETFTTVLGQTKMIPVGRLADPKLRHCQRGAAGGPY